MRYDHLFMDSQAPAGSSLRQTAAHSAFVTGGADAAARVLAVLLSLVAARLLGPTDVGTLGLAVTMVTILSVSGFFWETAAVVASGSCADATYAAAASVLRALTALVLVGGMIAAAPTLGAWLTSTPAVAEHLRALLSILLWTLVIEALGCHPRVILQRRLDLRYLAWLHLLAAVLFVIGAVALLLRGFGTSAVAWAQVWSSLVGLALTWLRPGHVRWSGWPAAEAWRSVCSGMWRLFAGGFLSFLGSRTDNLLVAGAIGETGMSFYSMAYNAARLPISILERITSFVLVPTLARIRDDSARVQSAVDQALRHFYLVAVPVSAALLVSAPALTELLLGERWRPVVPCLRVMCLGAIAAPALHTAGAVLVAFGRAHWIGVASATLLLFQVTAIPPLARRFGPLGAACSDLASVFLITAGLCHAARVAAPAIRWRLRAPLGLLGLAASCAGLLAWGVSFFPLGAPLVLVSQLAVIALGYPLFLWAWGGRDRLRDFVSLLPVHGLSLRPR